MVMPFNIKTVPDHGDVDYNALWDRAFFPLLDELGYSPVRADEDLGASIVADMLIRLTASDLVIADLSLANANVYYEVGVRHAARKPGCVLVAPEWAKPSFDLAGIRHVPYPLPPGELTDEVASTIKEALREPLPNAAPSASPVYELVPGYPELLPSEHSARFDAFVGHLTDFQNESKTIRASPKDEQRRRVQALLTKYPLDQPQSPAIVLELLRLVRDHLDFATVLEFIAQLPSDLATSPFVLEQQALALGKQQRHPEAVATLEQLIETHGSNPERQGLLGGRYKEAWRAALDQPDRAVDARRHLNRAIESYTTGMWLDLNEYYCASNLARLLRARRATDDEGSGRAGGGHHPASLRARPAGGQAGRVAARHPAGRRLRRRRRRPGREAPRPGDRPGRSRVEARLDRRRPPFLARRPGRQPRRGDPGAARAPSSASWSSWLRPPG